MTYGEQNSEAEGHEQMDYALDRGVNFFDTAEMYSVPPKSETYGRTEEVIGTWFAARKNRDKVILATKVVGPGERFKHVRTGDLGFDRANVTQAVEDSLKRLQTDYIDLYQLHWPERSVNSFGKLGYVHVEDETWTPLEETLAVLADLVKAGKIRHVGVSNETPWGMMKFAQLADAHGLPRMASNQNPYSLLNRSYEVGCAEVSIREDMGPGLFPWRVARYPAIGQRGTGGGADDAVPRHHALHQSTGPSGDRPLCRHCPKARPDPSQMALAYVNSRRFLTSNIIGATTMDPLKINIDSWDMTLAPEVLDEIEAVQVQHPNPGP